MSLKVITLSPLFYCYSVISCLLKKCFASRLYTGSHIKRHNLLKDLSESITTVQNEMVNNDKETRNKDLEDTAKSLNLLLGFPRIELQSIPQGRMVKSLKWKVLGWENWVQVPILPLIYWLIQYVWNYNKNIFLKVANIINI